VYSFTCGYSFHEMEIPKMENCLSSVTLASAVNGNFYFYLWHSVSPVPVFINSAVIWWKDLAITVYCYGYMWLVFQPYLILRMEFYWEKMATGQGFSFSRHIVSLCQLSFQEQPTFRCVTSMIIWNVTATCHMLIITCGLIG
jgi:hypothetical protein